MLTLDEILLKLQEIKKLGFVQTHRSGDTGIGKTLEDLLGIEENNFPSSNGHLIELKSGRKDKTNMITLFTKSPLPEKANTLLLRNYGYPSKRGNNKLELHTTIDAISFNRLRGRTGFRIQIKDDRINEINEQGDVLGYWTKDILKDSFERKLPEILYVKADFRGKGSKEEFWFNEAWRLKGMDFESFLTLIGKGDIKIDIRIGQYKDGRTHDHGTGFRVFPRDLDLCFKIRERKI
jgi:hypothetical protein